MPTQAPPVSTLADVLRQVAAALNGAGDGVTVMIGKKFLEEFGAGAPPRVLFVEEPRAGKMGPPRKLNCGYIASYTHVCAAYVRAAETGDEFSRLENAHTLQNRICAALKKADPANVIFAPGNPRDDSPLSVEAYGADIAFDFSYRRDIPQDYEILKAPVTAISPPNPDQPGGDTGYEFATDPTVTTG